MSGSLRLNRLSGSSLSANVLRAVRRASMIWDRLRLLKSSHWEKPPISLPGAMDRSMLVKKSSSELTGRLPLTARNTTGAVSSPSRKPPGVTGSTTWARASALKSGTPMVAPVVSVPVARSNSRRPLVPREKPVWNPRVPSSTLSPRGPAVTARSKLGLRRPSAVAE